MYILLDEELELRRWMSLHFENSALARSDNNQHNDSQTYCDALFIFVCVWLPATIWQPSHSNVFGLQAVRSEKGGNGSYIAYLSCKEGLLQQRGKRGTHWEYSS